MTTIAGINLDGFEEALGGSSEEAAKKFLEIAGIGIGQVVADAMDQALNSTVGAGNPQDWVVLIGPCFLNVSFTVPEGTQPRRINTIATPSTSALGGDVKGSISVSLKIEFQIVPLAIQSFVPSFEHLVQEQNNWCWAACMQMVVAERPSQCGLANWAFHSGSEVCCHDGSTSICDRPLPVAQITGEWLRSGYTAGYSLGAIGEAELVATLSRGHVIEMGIRWIPWGGHAVLIVGYDTDEEGGVSFTVFDPLDGIMIGSYAELLNAFSAGVWKWSWEVEIPNTGGNNGDSPLS